jgi:hypothetical protein
VSAPEKAAPQHPEAGAEPRQEAITGPPVPALLIAQAQFADMKMPDGKTVPVPGPAKLTIARLQDGKWTTTILEDRDSNVFHKAMPVDAGGSFLTIGGTQAMLKTWQFANGKWEQTTHWNPKFGGKIDRLRDLERGDVDGDGKEELVIATHDQGDRDHSPDEKWRAEQIDQTKTPSSTRSRSATSTAAARQSSSPRRASPTSSTRNSPAKSPCSAGRTQRG